MSETGYKPQLHNIVFELGSKLNIEKDRKMVLLTPEVIQSGLGVDQQKLFDAKTGSFCPFLDVWVEYSNSKFGAFVSYDATRPATTVLSFVTFSDGKVKRSLFVLLFQATNLTVSKQNKFLRYKRGFKPLNWFDESSILAKSCVITYNAKQGESASKELDDFLRGKKFIDELSYASLIREQASLSYQLLYDWLSVLYGIDNNILAREIIPPSNNKKEYSDGIKGNAERIIKVSITPKPVLQTKSHNGQKGTPQREHEIRGHFMTYGNCKQGIPDRLNLCEE